jgi:menaquinone-dependent protoporphyrinogen oxidase
VLVAYATKYGATAEIAEKVGEVLGQAGLDVDVTPVKSVRDLDAYNAVVLGSAVYVGQWRKPAVKFLKANAQKLAEMPVWVFSSGPSGEGDPVELVNGWLFPDGVKEQMEQIQPKDTAVFHGAVFAEKLGLIEKQMIKTVKAPTGDFRDWDAIAAWAAGIADALKVTT